MSRRMDQELRAPLPAPRHPGGCELPPAEGSLNIPREDEHTCIEALDALFATDGGTPLRSLVVLHGDAGSGKTGLAVRWAHRARALFPDGRLFVGLGGRGPGTALPSTATGMLLTALGLGPQHIPPTAGDRRSLLRTACAGRRLLLVLDDAASAAQVRCVLPGPGTCVLVTSRHPLHGLPDAASVPLHRPAPPAPAPPEAPSTCRTRHASTA